MTLTDLFFWFEETAVGTAVRDSYWLFPAIQSVHLIGIASLAGAVLATELRLLNVVFRELPIVTVLREARPWLIISIVVMVATGIPLFLSAPWSYYDNTSFWVKITAFLAVLLYTFAIRNPLLRRWRSAGTTRELVFKGLALVSIGAWLTVAAAGRWIGFS